MFETKEMGIFGTLVATTSAVAVVTVWTWRSPYAESILLFLLRWKGDEYRREVEGFKKYGKIPAVTVSIEK